MIRPARPDEAFWVRALVRRAYSLYIPRMGKEPAPMLADYGALIAAGEVQVLEEGGEAVALIVIYPKDDALFIENLAVDPVAQGKGYGRALLDFAEREARRLGLKALRLYTNAAMTENLAFYPGRGFRETERREEDGYKRVFFEKRVEKAFRGRSIFRWIDKTILTLSALAQASVSKGALSRVPASPGAGRTGCRPVPSA